jgi:(p)ppGpp synthase/HD superfamily hydrolase
MNRETLLNKALQIAEQAHAGQKDKSGNNYISHPMRVSAKGKNENERIVGLLHDVVEDSNISLDDLIEAGFSTEIVNAVGCLTKRDGESLEDYIARIKQNPLAKSVKFYDLEDNTDPIRLNKLDPYEREHLSEKYQLTKDLLTR